MSCPIIFLSLHPFKSSLKMTDYIRLKKGLDLPITGSPDPVIKKDVISDVIAIKPTDFKGLVPKLPYWLVPRFSAARWILGFNLPLPSAVRWLKWSEEKRANCGKSELPTTNARPSSNLKHLQPKRQPVNKFVTCCCKAGFGLA